MAGATRSLEYNIPERPEFPEDFVPPEERHLDIFDFLQYVFGFQVCFFLGVSRLCTLCLELAQCGFDCDILPPLDIVSLIKMDKDIGCNTLHVSESHM